MTRFIVLFALIGVLSVHSLSSLHAAPLSQASNNQPDNPAKGKPIRDQYMVMLKESADGQFQDSLNQRHSATQTSGAVCFNLRS